MDESEDPGVMPSDSTEASRSTAPVPSSGPIRIAGLVACAAVAVGSIGPWAKISGPIVSITKYGTGGDGVLTLIGAALALLFFLVRVPAGALAMSGLMLAVVIYDLVDVNRVAGNASAENIDVTTGWGIWLAGLGALGIAVSAIVAMRAS